MVVVFDGSCQLSGRAGRPQNMSHANVRQAIVDQHISPPLVIKRTNQTKFDQRCLFILTLASDEQRPRFITGASS
jgi:hypothetical protein